MTINEKKYEDALEAIRYLFSDTSVSRKETINGLRSLSMEIDDLIFILENEEKTNEKKL